MRWRSPAARCSVRPRWLALAGATLVSWLAGCYGPPSLPEGAPCQRTEQCPDPQVCALGRCSLREPASADARLAAPPDATTEATTDAAADAAADAAIDAMAPACGLVGLSCPGGTATMFSCGGHCWVKCTAAVQRSAARTACMGWTGALGEIDDATEQACVASHIATATFWFGAIQSDAATTPGGGWTWNGTQPVVYTSWTPGKPDDADGVEDGAEQCGTIRPGGWDDDNCNQMLPFFCERP